MLSQTLRFATGLHEYPRLITAELRARFLVENLFKNEEIQLVCWESDRTITGSAVPLGTPLSLGTFKELDATHFCQRRELGVLNIGGPGSVVIDGKTYELNPLDGLYIGKGAGDISFSSASVQEPARFFLISYPAHATHPTTLIRHAEARQLRLGKPETANQRVIHQYIHEEGVKSCQLVMGFTRLESGNIWNTMPPHTHLRRTEVYCYFNVPGDGAVVHLMGTGNETRHLIVHNEQMVLSPAWSIHCGCGTQAYSFIWTMGGENQRFGDMDGIAIPDLV